MPEYRLGYGGLLAGVSGNTQLPALIKIDYRSRFAGLVIVIFGNKQLPVLIK